MKLSKVKLLLVSFLIIVGVFIAGAKLFASSGSNMYGYLWSSNIGWIDLNDCSNPADSTTCAPNASYGVSVMPSAPGTMSGYAWSSNVGWITFNASGCPKSGCTQGAYATWNANGTATIKGWARVCSVYASGCSGALKSSAYLGTWDGYIALDSTTAGGSGGTWGLTIGTDKKIGGYAWGSNVIGWIGSINASVYVGGPTVTLTATPSSILYGDKSTLKVTAANIDNANACTITGDPSGTIPKLTMSGSGSSWTGSVSVSPTADTAYTVTCTKGNQTAKAQASVTVTYFDTPPSSSNAGSGGSGGSGYCTDNAPQFAWNTDATTCTITQGSNSQSVPGSSQDTSSAFGSTLSKGTDGRYYYTDGVLPITGTSTTYTLQCSDGSAPVNIKVDVASCSASPDVSQPGNTQSSETTTPVTKPPVFNEF